MHIVLINQIYENNCEAFLVNYEKLNKQVQNAVDIAYSEPDEILEIDVYEEGIQSMENDPSKTTFDWLISGAHHFYEKVESYREITFKHTL